jgi:glycosyltransferase involved in cell wall biosynthesis
MQEPIRVCQIMGKMIGGGVEHVVMNYYRHIDRSRVQFDFLVDADSTLVPTDEMKSLGARVFVIPPYQHQLSYQRELRKLFQKYHWCIVHSHINTLSLFPLYAAKASGVPVRIAHSHATAGKGEYAKNGLKYMLRPFANLYPTHRLACSEYAGRWLFGNAPFDVMVNGFDIEALRYKADARISLRSSLGLADSTFVYGHVGRFAAPKNQERLIYLFAEVVKDRPDVALAFAGQGPDLESCRRLVHDLGLDGKVFFLGQFEQTQAFYSAIDAFMLPSTYEGLGLALVEAQVSGLPCIASAAVSQEANPTGKVTFIDIDDQEGWKAASLALTPRKDRVLTPTEREALNAFDINSAAPKLTVYYEKLMAGYISARKAAK